MSETKSQQTNDSNNNRVWFVTGASSGFGRAISSAALERGDRVVATARDTDSVAELTERGDGRALALELDVTDAEAARAAFDEAVSRFGRVDVVVNNAGYGHIGAVEELTDDEWHQQLDVNLFGVINVTRAALPQLRKQRSGHLVQMSSLNGVEGLPGGAYYSASKFAVEGLSESLADEVGHLGIDVTIVEPGPHRTRFASDRSTKQADAIEDYAPSVGQTREAVGELDGNQPGDPERAARAIIDAVEAEDPPRRLALGQVAVDNIRAKLNAQLSELDEWAAVSASSDYPEEDEAG